MAALLPEILYQCDGQAPPPSKDFYQLQVTRSEVGARRSGVVLCHGKDGQVVAKDLCVCLREALRVTDRARAEPNISVYGIGTDLCTGIGKGGASDISVRNKD